MTTVVCFGEVLLRLTAPGRTLLLQHASLDANFAGAEANVAVALAHLGHRTRIATVLPDTALGRAARDAIRAHGPDTSAIRFGPGRMGLYFLVQGAVRRPSEILYDRIDSAFALAPDACEPARGLQRGDWFHTSGVTPALGPKAADASIEAMRQARAAGAAVSFDGNYRSALWRGRESEAPAILKSLFAEADIVFGTERDIGRVLGRDFAHGDREGAATAAFAAFPRLERIAATKRVQHGIDTQDLSATMFTRREKIVTKSIAMTGIVDRIGAGDAFAAGVLHGLLSGHPDDRTLDLGLAAAIWKHSVPGDFCPMTEDDLNGVLTDGSVDVKR